MLRDRKFQTKIFPGVERLNISEKKVFLGCGEVRNFKKDLPGVERLKISNKHFPGVEILKISKKISRV